MCGISGIYSSSRPVLKSDIQIMNDLQRHRGPDGDGIFHENKIGLGHRRLSIIDLSKRAEQPMVSSNGRFVLSYNGECYNFKELRHELQNKGHLFQSSSDTEVVLNAFLEWGVNAFPKMNGMFALAIWDRKEQELTLARDRFGIKPLYIYEDSQRLIFASEIKAIVGVTKEFEVNTSRIPDFLALRYAPDNETLFQNVSAFPAATYRQYRDNQVIENRYWSPHDIAENQEFSPETLLDLLRDSVRYRLQADVPVGSFLSGGIDSASLASLSAEQNRHLSTFTYDVEDELSEFSAAKEIAESLGHTSNLVSGFSISELSDVLWHLEEPLGDSIILPTNSLAKEAAKSLKVVLSGEGADEIFNGYVHHYVLYQLNRYRSISRPIAKLAEYMPIALINRLLPYPQDLDKSSIQRALKRVQKFDSSMEGCRDFVRICEIDQIQRYLRIETHPVPQKTSERYSGSFLKQITLQDLEGWNQKYTLLRLDRLTMAHSLEARVPFLDHRIAEYILSLKPSEKISAFQQKQTLRAAMKQQGLSKKIVNRRKQAFYLHLKQKRQFAFQSFVEEHFLRTDSPDSFWNGSEVRSLIARGKERSFVEDKLLFSILTLDIWKRKFSEFQKELLRSQHSFSTSNILIE